MNTTPYEGVFGLYYFHSSKPVTLPLVSVRATASLKDLVARVSLAQTYHNDSPHLIEATYTFPIPARGAVCSFQMVKEDGTKVVGLVQEKEEARRTYDSAVDEGKLASLMEQQSPDVFQVSVGNLKHKETVTIELSYVTEVTEDEENDTLRVHIPAHIGARYGTPPSSTSSRPSVTLPTSGTPIFQLSISIETVHPISRIGCPGHTVETSLGPDPSLSNAADLPFFNFARVSFSSPTSLDKDFILTLKSAALDSPHCVLEVHPKDETIALGLTMVPRFKLPDLSRQEFVLLVDRSGSMGSWGDGAGRIATAKKALVVMLRSLPSKDCVFNVVSFGSLHSSLWKDSQPYNQATLDKATSHVDSMDADMGGTEIKAALESVFTSRKIDRPTSLFVLTDGDAWDLDATLASIKSAVESAKKDAYLRVFVLGIGDSASTAMCGGIARVGNGSSQFVVDGESFTGKTARLLKAARTPLITNICVDWGILPPNDVEDDGFELLSDAGDEEKVEKVEPPTATLKNISLFDENVDPLDVKAVSTSLPPPPPVTLPPPPPVQQSPYIIRALSPGTRLYVYAILAWKRGSPLPTAVTLRGSVEGGEELEVVVPVALSHLLDDGSPPPVHTIAARKIILDLEDGKHNFESIEDVELKSRTVKAAIVLLGKKYGLSSTQTSFVTVDESEVDAARKQPFLAVVVDYPEVDAHSFRRGMPVACAMFAAAPGGGSQVFPSGFSQAPPPPPRAMGYGLASAAYALSAPQQAFPAPSPTFDFGGVGASESKKAAPRSGPFGRVSKLLSRSAPSEPMDDAESTSATPSFDAVPPPAPSSTRFSDADRLEAIARLQSFDGSFDVGILKVCETKVGIEAVVALLPSKVEEGRKVAATLVAMAYLAKKLCGEKEAWEGMYAKAREFCEGAMGEKVEVEELVASVWAAMQ